MKRVLILGGSGFIGRALAARLVSHGHHVTVPTRLRDRAKALFVLPTCEVVEANVHDRAALVRLMEQKDIVVNLVGILAGDFDRVHVALPATVAEAALEAGVKHLVHMSAIGANPEAPETSPSKYLRSRGKGEAWVREITAGTGIAVSVFRPSVVFGREDNFINMLAGLVRKFPVVPLGSPKACFQVVWVEDVARAISMAVSAPAEGVLRTYPLVGPTIYTLDELVRFVAKTLSVQRVIVPLPDSLARAQAMSFEFPPGKWIAAALGIAMTRDNVDSMTVPSISDTPFPAQFGSPSSLEAIVPTYLGRNST
jgi:NADH dehydrogenase